MELYKPVSFDFFPELVKFTVADIYRQFAEKNMTLNDVSASKPTYKHELPRPLLDKINTELISNGWPEFWYIRTYIRLPNTRQQLHLDGGITEQSEYVHSAINIPVFGAENTKHIWKIGDFNTMLSPCGTYRLVKMTKETHEPVELIIDKPYLLKIDIPHYVISNSTDHRWVITLRFKGNPRYEDLARLLE